LWKFSTPDVLRKRRTQEKAGLEKKKTEAEKDREEAICDTFVANSHEWGVGRGAHKNEKQRVTI